MACATLELNKTACTSVLCSWKKARKRAHPAPLSKIDFRRPKKTETLPKVDDPFEDTIKGFVSPDPIKFITGKDQEHLDKLRQIAPDAVIFKSISLWLDDDQNRNSDTDSANENEQNSLPEPLTFIYEPTAINKTDAEVKNIAVKNYEIYTKSCFQNQYDNLKKVTALQSISSKWMLHRAGRITASISKSAFTCDLERTKTLVDTVMQYKDQVDVVATRYGKRMETRARDVYTKKLEQIHTNFQVKTTGLHINTDFPYLGASPDGIVQCDCHGLGLVEIKCPFKFKKSLKNWRQNKLCPINLTGEFKQNHAYYFQVQHQMLVTDTKYCDFFVFSQGNCAEDTFLLRVERNDKFCQSLLLKLSETFQKVILPELVTRKNDPNLQNEEKLYCLCRRPSFPPMIGCDNYGTCEIEWYHYSCVNITRAPKKWLCPNCSKKS